MTFDTRARRAVQGINRAVEVMEMSSTKTPQRLTRFDQYREGKSRNKRIAALAVGIAVPVVLLVGAVLVLGPDRDQNVPITPPSTSTSVAPTSVSGSSDQFKAPFTYTVPQDWTFSGEGARYFSLDSTDGSAHLIVLSNVVANAADCSDRPKQGVGTSSDAMTSWLSTHPALDATTPRPVRLGAATGSYVDVQLTGGQHRKNCPNGLGLVTAQPDHPQGWSIGAGAKERVYVLDLPSGGTVTIVITAYQASDFGNVIDQATPVVESFDFRK
ncbi:MAG: hypothetical protein M3P43_15145 [Actinomycetota bacterium]|nr:hypothetical protein [Actinomycetota bacterium]